MEELNNKLLKLVQDYQNKVIIFDEALVILEGLIILFSQNVEEENIHHIKKEFQNLLKKIENSRKINKKLCNNLLDNIVLRESLNII